jgi:hypothetical protein
MQLQSRQLLQFLENPKSFYGRRNGLLRYIYNDKWIRIFIWLIYRIFTRIISMKISLFVGATTLTYRFYWILLSNAIRNFHLRGWAFITRLSSSGQRVYLAWHRATCFILRLFESISLFLCLQLWGLIFMLFYVRSIILMEQYDSLEL